MAKQDFFKVNKNGDVNKVDFKHSSVFFKSKNSIKTGKFYDKSNNQ